MSEEITEGIAEHAIELNMELEHDSMDWNLYGEVFNKLTQPMTQGEWYNKCLNIYGVEFASFVHIVDYLIKHQWVTYELITKHTGDEDSNVIVTVRQYYPLP